MDLAIERAVKVASRFFKEVRRQAASRGQLCKPPSFETFSTMAKGLMEATKQVDIDRLKNVNMRELFERTWAQKLLNYSTQKLLKDVYEALS